MAKIYIFSGEDIVSSRNAYIDQIEFLKKQKQENCFLPKLNYLSRFLADWSAK